jgi:hypothetical protein
LTARFAPPGREAGRSRLCYLPPMRFTREFIAAAGFDWERPEAINQAMDVLTKQRVAAVHVTGDRRRSKLAFKFTVLRQSFTYRLVDLGDGTIDQWQAGNTLVCIVLARAFFETVAVVDWISGNLRKLLDSRNVKGLDRLAMQGLFGAKSKFWQWATPTARLTSSPLSII